ncbi:MAG: DUF427 domain-containing protein [Pseudomonadota bacterium]
MSSLPTENVHDYPRPPALQPVTYPLLVKLGGSIAAKTNAGLRVLETHHAPTYYFPPDSILALLTPSGGQSYCEWKGQARYFDVACGDAVVARAAWTYEKPSDGFRQIAGYLAFYANLMEACFVAGEAARPQPGSFYGGWVTSNLEGIPKGARGTEHW